MRYTEISISLSPRNEQFFEILIANLAEIGYESFSETDNALLAYIPEKDFDFVRAETIVNRVVTGNFNFELSHKVFEDKNWNALWESNFEPITVENFCRVRAPFHPPNNECNLEIVIEPKMSFGTGHHQTTWLMVRELFSIDLKGKTILDMGCGTGILAIVAEKLGAAKILAIDIDEWATSNTAENIEANTCKKIAVELGDVQKIFNKSFDIILANINLNVLLKDMLQYYKHLNNNGLILISGILKTDIETITEAATKVGFETVNVNTRNDWVMIKFVKK
jgi:ribosomal protein L11 methyltransferase